MKVFMKVVLLCFLGTTLLAYEKPQAQERIGHQIDSDEPFFSGKITEVRHGGGYTYMLIKEHTDESFWIVIDRTDAKLGDTVRFQKQLVAKNFKSKGLNRKFDEIMFVEKLEYKVE